MSSTITDLTAELFWLQDFEFDLAFKNSVSNLLQCFPYEGGDIRESVINLIERFFKIMKKPDNSTDGEIIQKIVLELVREFSKNLTRAENAELSKCSLEENVRILTTLDVLMNTLASTADLKVEVITSVPKDIISTLLVGFEYCKNSSNVTAVNDQLTQLFKTCYTLLRSYFLFINKLQINCQFESEFNLLMEILDIMYEIGTLVVLLDLKTMAELWKGYAEVLKTYSSHLRSEFNVSKVIRFLISQITERITNLQTSYDDKVLNLTTKIGVFLLKIVVKLCEYFELCFGDCSAELLEFVLFLYKHSQYLGEISKLSVDLTSKIDTLLLPGIDPLLNILVNDRQFVGAYLNYNCSEKANLDKAAFLLLSSLILRKLLVCSDETVNTWISDTEPSILHHTFKTIRDCDKELYYDSKINLSCSDATLSQEVYIYDALLIGISTLIVNEIDSEKFSIVESLLMENLLNSSPSVGLFICDLWCILSRYGSPELCHEHVKFLISVSNEVPEGDVLVLVRSLLRRLFGFLSINHQLQVITELPLDENFINCYNCLGTKFRTQIGQKTVSDVANKYKNLQANLKQAFDDGSYAKMIHLINLFCTLRPAFWKDYTSSVIEFIVGIWRKLRSPLLSQITSNEFRSIFVSLPYLTRITCTLILQLSNSQVLDILRSIRCLMSNESLRIRLCCLKILQSLQYYQIDTYFDEITGTLAECFKCGLVSSHPMVKQFFLDGFNRFSHVTSYEVIVLSTVSKDKSIAEYVAQYLKKNPTPVAENQTFYQFLSTLVENASKVEAIESTASSEMDIDVDDEEISSSKRIKLEDDLDDEITRVESLLNHIFERVRNKQINQQQREAVVALLGNLGTWRGYL